MNSNKRILFVDFAKAIAIILMVILHSSYIYPDFNAYIGAFHMAVFFFVAGLFAKGKETSIRDVVIKSFKQLIIPYFAFSIIALTYGWVYAYLHPMLYKTDGSFGDILKKEIIGILLMRDRVTVYSYQPCAALWFLSSLFWCRVFFSIWIHDGKKYLYIFRFLIIVFLVICNYFHISIFAFDSTAVSFLYYILGFYLNRFLIRDFTKINVWYFGFLAILAIISMLFLKEHSVMPDDASINGNPFLAYLKGILGVATVMSIAIILEKSGVKPITRVLKYVGEATITILGLHLAGVILFKTIYVLLGFPKERVSLYAAVPVCILICLGCAFIHHQFFARKHPWVIGKKK